MEFCAIHADDQDVKVAARPDAQRDPDWWMLLRGSVAELRHRMDKPLPATGYTSWPTVPDNAGPVGMFVCAWALLTVVPDLIEVHRQRGIDYWHAASSAKCGTALVDQSSQRVEPTVRGLTCHEAPGRLAQGSLHGTGAAALEPVSRRPDPPRTNAAFASHPGRPPLTGGIGPLSSWSPTRSSRATPAGSCRLRQGRRL